MSIGSQITALRVAQGMSKTALANKLGVSTTAVWNWEEENTTPRPHLVPKIAQALGVDVATLANGNSVGTKPESPLNGGGGQIDQILERAKADLASALGVSVARVRLEFTLSG